MPWCTSIGGSGLAALLVCVCACVCVCVEYVSMRDSVCVGCHCVSLFLQWCVSVCVGLCVMGACDNTAHALGRGRAREGGNGREREREGTGGRGGHGSV